MNACDVYGAATGGHAVLFVLADRATTLHDLATVRVDASPPVLADGAVRQLARGLISLDVDARASFALDDAAASPSKRHLSF